MKEIVSETELYCSEGIAKALYDCATTIPIARPDNKLILAQTVETLSRSLEILYRIKKEVE